MPSRRAGSSPADILIIGVGNSFRSDDAAGLEVARRLRSLDLPHVTIAEATGEGSALLALWEGHDVVFVVDAVASGSAAGTIHRFDAIRDRLPARAFRHSTHALSVADAIEMARTLKRLPGTVQFYGIEGRSFAAGTRMSAAVRRSAAKVVKIIRSECEALHGRR